MIITNAAGEKQIIVMLGETERAVRTQMIHIALENNDYHITNAAKSLGMKRSTLHMRMKAWGIPNEKKDSTHSD